MGDRGRFDDNASVADMGVTFDSNGKALLIKKTLTKAGKMRHIMTTVPE